MRSVGSDAPDRCEVGELPRIVFDTNVFVTAVTSRDGVSTRRFLAARAGLLQVIASPMLIDGLADVRSRPKFRRHLGIEDALRFVEAIQELAVVVDHPRGRAIPSPMIPATTSPAGLSKPDTGRRVASHVRDYGRRRYVTEPAHRPPAVGPMPSGRLDERVPVSGSCPPPAATTQGSTG